MRLRLSLESVHRAFTILALLIVGCSPIHYVQVYDHSITLYYQNKDAAEVLFASSLDQFQFHRATKEVDGIWEVTVPKAEEFSYFYLVDKRVTLPNCQSKILDDFGAKNCIFVSDL